MTIIEALKYSGKIKRKYWMELFVYVNDIDQSLYFSFDDDPFNNVNDLIAEDWEPVSDQS